jgi:glutathione S-transferase
MAACRTAVSIVLAKEPELRLSRRSKEKSWCQMAHLKLTYFDFAGSRGEEVRLALALAGVPFEDNRIDRGTFAARKSEFPFGAVPVLEVAGRGTFGQSNAILRLIGRSYGLHPEDPFEAARHDALMDAAEDLRHRISPTMRMENPAEKKAARQQLAADYIPLWGRCVDRQVGTGPFVGGARPNVADIKLYIVERWISSGSLDDIPSDIFDPYSRLKALVGAVRTHPAVVGWYAASS